MAAPGRVQMKHLRQLLESQPLAGRVPLPKLVPRRDGSTDTSSLITERIAATGGADGTWALVYTPRGASFSVDLGQLRGPTLAAHWFDPRTGERQSLGELENTSQQSFNPPGEPGPGKDWILALTAKPFVER